MFDRAWCVNLDRRADRWEQFQRRLPADWPFCPIERFSAVDGQVDLPPRWYGTGGSRKRLRGAWGCFQSHLRIWRQAFDDGLDNVLVFEDDAIFCEDFAARALAFLAAVPCDWCQVYLGGQHLKTDRHPPRAVNDQVLRCYNVNRTHAYTIRRPMLEYVVGRFSAPWRAHTERKWHIDHQLCQLHSTGRWCVYAPTRFLVGQAMGPSDVAVAMLSHMWWNQFPYESAECSTG